MKSSNHLFKQVLFLAVFFLALFLVKSGAFGKQSSDKDSKVHSFSTVHFYNTASLNTLKISPPCKTHFYLNKDYTSFSLKCPAAFNSDRFNLPDINNRITINRCGFYHTSYLYSHTETEPPPITNGFC